MSGAVTRWAFVGAAELVTGELRADAVATGKLPWHFPLLGAMLLILAIGIPMAVTSSRAVAGHRRAATATVVSNIILICCVLGQMAMTHTQLAAPGVPSDDARLKRPDVRRAELFTSTRHDGADWRQIVDSLSVRR